jgi:amino acid transporter/nucleotide-binding universal stress UspA family protein
MATTEGPSAAGGSGIVRAARIIVVSSVMLTFISYWRTAAVVLCDLASTAYYIGAAVENAIGPAAPWFILAVMLFSYAVRSVYIESSALFVRGGVYRVVKEALGGFLAKLSVSALMFDYILTGPTSSVSAGSYIMGWLMEILRLTSPGTYEALGLENDDVRKAIKNYGAVIIACAVTLYFFRQNLLGIHESSDKALKIMIATTVMGVIMLLWCGLTLVVRATEDPGSVRLPPFRPDLNKKYEPEIVKERDPVTGEMKDAWVINPRTRAPFPRVADRTRLIAQTIAAQGLASPGSASPFIPQAVVPLGVAAVDASALAKKVERESEALGKVGIRVQEDPLGLIGKTALGGEIREATAQGSWLSIFGILGLFIAFGHSILAMSGEETLAQVYREVESPKLPNFKRAAFIVFVYSLVLTAGISFLAVMIIPDSIRMKEFNENLIGGLARYVIGPPLLKLFLEGFVVIVGFLILAGAVNTAIIGSNGVLNRVAEDGVMPDWFRKPHPKYGTSYRILYLILFLQLGVILLSRGDMVLLTEAYAFGVVWSFVFKALSMVVLRFKDKTPREYKVPLNIPIGKIEVPLGLGLIFLTLAITALLNLFTKEVATGGGIIFTLLFLCLFVFSERAHEARLRGGKHEHLEHFNRASADELTPQGLGLKKPYRKLVAIRSPQNLFMLEKSLAETDPDTTDVVVMTAKVLPAGQESAVPMTDLDSYDQHLMTAVVDRAEKAGKVVHPIIVTTNNPLNTVLRMAKDLGAQELIIGASNKYTADEQLEQIALYWFNLFPGEPVPLTVRILSRVRDVSLDLAGGNRIPKVTERQAKSVAELRAAGVGVDRVLLAHDGGRESREMFEALLTMLDPNVVLGVVPVGPATATTGNGVGALRKDCERAEKVGREVDLLTVNGAPGPALVKAAREGEYDLIVIPLPAERPAGGTWMPDPVASWVLGHAHCKVFLAAPPLVPHEVDEQ